MSIRHAPRNFGFTYARVIAFLVGCGVLIVFVTRYYLYPAMEAAGQASPRDRKVLAAHAWLLLAVVLFILLVLMILTFRIGRFFFPRPGQRAKPTDYPDAWAESARRVKVDEEEGDNDV